MVSSFSAPATAPLMPSMMTRACRAGRRRREPTGPFDRVELGDEVGVVQPVEVGRLQLELVEAFVHVDAAHLGVEVETPRGARGGAVERVAAAGERHGDRGG